MIDDWYHDSFIDDLHRIFKPREIVQSPGIGDVYILKYDDFYLKIYPDENQEDTYIIERYNGYSQRVEAPASVDSVRSNKLKQYALTI